MGKYLKLRAIKPTFKQCGLTGFQFALDREDLEFYEVDVRTGHDNYIISRKITHIYYILSGVGTFTINRKSYKVQSGNLVAIPPKVEYTYSGRMKLLLITTPAWFPGNEIRTKKNPQAN